MGASVHVLAGGSIYQQSGLPDRLVAYRGLMFLVEFKKEDASLKTNQKLVKREIEATKNLVFVCRHREGGLVEIEGTGYLWYPGDCLVKMHELAWKAASEIISGA